VMLDDPREAAFRLRWEADQDQRAATHLIAQATDLQRNAELLRRQAETEMRAAALTQPAEIPLKIVRRYSLLAAGAGLLPGGLINFSGVLAVQVLMVSRIAKAFGLSLEGTRVRAAVSALLGSATHVNASRTIGVLAGTSVPVVGTLLFNITSPAVAYGLTQAVGRVFVMHFQSGGTLLHFDPHAFREYMLPYRNTRTWRRVWRCRT
jgi:uncharacterized protein (DUF697 family)